MRREAQKSPNAKNKSDVQACNAEAGQRLPDQAPLYPLQHSHKPAGDMKSKRIMGLMVAAYLTCSYCHIKLKKFMRCAHLLATYTSVGATEQGQSSFASAWSTVCSKHRVKTTQQSNLAALVKRHVWQSSPSSICCNQNDISNLKQESDMINTDDAQ